MKHHRILQDGISSCRCSMDISRRFKRQQRKKCESNAQTRFCLCKKIRSRTMVILRAWIREKVVSNSEDSPQGEWDKMAEKDDGDTRRKRTPSLPSHESMSRGQLKSKGGGKLSIHYCADQETITTVFRNNYFCKTAQSLQSSRRNCVKNMNPFLIERGQSSSSFVPSVTRQTCL